jgi:hypothetical protein
LFAAKNEKNKERDESDTRRICGYVFFSFIFSEKKRVEIMFHTFSCFPNDMNKQ